MTRFSIAISLVALLLSQSGCIIDDIADAARLSMQRCTVESDPSGADIRVNGKYAGNSPCEFARPFGDAGRNDFQITASLDGYYSEARDFKDFPTYILFELQPKPTEDQQYARSVDCDLSELPALDDPPSVAVFDFRVDDDISPSAGEALADFCRQAVQESRRLLLVDRENMRSLLTEEDFAASVQCDDTRCLVDYGRKLRAQFVIHGRAAKIGRAYVLSLKMLDVATTELISIRNTKSHRSLEDFLNLAGPTTCELLHDALSQLAQPNES